MEIGLSEILLKLEFFSLDLYMLSRDKYMLLWHGVV